MAIHMWQSHAHDLHRQLMDCPWSPCSWRLSGSGRGYEVSQLFLFISIPTVSMGCNWSAAFIKTSNMSCVCVCVCVCVYVRVMWWSRPTGARWSGQPRCCICHQHKNFTSRPGTEDREPLSHPVHVCVCVCVCVCVECVCVFVCVCRLSNACGWDLIIAGHIPSRKIKEAKWTRSLQPVWAIHVWVCVSVCVCVCVCVCERLSVMNRSLRTYTLQISEENHHENNNNATMKARINTRGALQANINYSQTQRTAWRCHEKWVCTGHCVAWGGLVLPSYNGLIHIGWYITQHCLPDTDSIPQFMISDNKYR